jgi:hypothetical protein
VRIPENDQHRLDVPSFANCYRAPVQTAETELDMALRHVARGSLIVERQRLILDRLRMRGHPTATAETLLAAMESAQQMFEERADRLAKMVAESDSGQFGTLNRTGVFFRTPLLPSR